MHRFRGGDGGGITFDLPSSSRNATFHVTTRPHLDLLLLIPLVISVCSVLPLRQDEVS